MLHIQKKYKIYEKKDGENTYRLFFHLDNIERIEMDKLIKDYDKDESGHSLTEFAFKVCVKALKKIEGFSGEFDMADADVRAGILSCSELIEIHDMQEISFEVRGLGEFRKAVENLRATVEDTSSQNSPVPTASTAGSKDRGHGKNAKKRKSA